MTSKTKPQESALPIKNHYTLLLMLTAFILMILPFITTFNEFLTSLALRSDFFLTLRSFVVPVQLRMVAALISLFGIETSVSPDTIHLLQSNGIYKNIYMSWNCIGWQSLILLFISFITGLQGNYKTASKIETILIGLLGTILMNILRITLVVLIGWFFGNFPAIIFHDYVSTLMILAWLLLFWFISYRYILEPQNIK